MSSKYFKNKIQFVTQELQQIEAELALLPSGDIKAYSNKNSYRWYYVNQQGRTYLSRDNLEFAKQLTRKKYLLLKKAALIEKKYILESKCVDESDKAEKDLQAFLENPAYTELLSSTNAYSKQQQDWVLQEFNSNPNYKEQLTFACPSGHLVRSKSEVFIDMALTGQGIPFRYECELIIGKYKFYPDFAILNPNTNEIIYWEHLGKMDDFDYARNAFNKIKLYHQQGIIPGLNLILTFESKNNPFSFSKAKAALECMNI